MEHKEINKSDRKGPVIKAIGNNIIKIVNDCFTKVSIFLSI